MTSKKGQQDISGYLGDHVNPKGPASLRLNSVLWVKEGQRLLEEVLLWGDPLLSLFLLRNKQREPLKH